MKEGISIVLAVHNLEETIGDVVDGIINNVSNNVKEMFIILDACTDNSEDVILRSLIWKSDTLDVKIVYANYNNKLIAHNIGCCSSEYKYSLIVPDDMVINEKNFDKRLLKSFDGNIPDARYGNVLVLLENSKLVELNFEDLIDE